MLDPEQRRLLETCASLIALSLERDQSVLEAHEAQLQVQAEQLRNSLLSSVSHDLRTPLAAMAGAASSLLEERPETDPATNQLLLQTIVDESHRLARLVDNLLDMTRLESGAVALNRQWHVLEEIVGSALSRLRRELGSRPVRVDSPADLPLLFLDGMLMEQVFVNLLENARALHARQQSDRDCPSPRGVGEWRFGSAIADPDCRRGAKAAFLRSSFAPQPRRQTGVAGSASDWPSAKRSSRRTEGRSKPRTASPCGAEFLLWLPYDSKAPRVALDEPLSTKDS